MSLKKSMVDLQVVSCPDSANGMKSSAAVVPAGQMLQGFVGVVGHQRASSKLFEEQAVLSASTNKLDLFYISLYRPAPWTIYCPQFASKMGTYVSRDFFLTTEFAVRMYVRCTVKYLFRSFSGSSNLSPKLR